MARIRTIKPDFWTDEKIVALPFEARLLYIGLWNFADDEGYILDEPLRIKMQVFPADGVDVAAHIESLIRTGRLSRRETEDGRTVLQIINFARHQAISHKAPSRFRFPKTPEPSGKLPNPPENSGALRNPLSGIEGNRREREKDGGPPLPGEGIRAAAVPIPPKRAEKFEEATPPSTDPWKELRPLSRGTLKQPPTCPRCGKPLFYFETRTGSRYSADRWYCDEKAEGCSGKFPEIEWEDPGGGGRLRRRPRVPIRNPDRERKGFRPLLVSEKYLDPEPAKEEASGV